MVKINEMNETRRSSSRIKTIKSNKGAVRQRKKEEALDAAMKKPAKTQQRVKDTHGDVSAGAAVGKVYAEGKGAGRGANMSSYTRVKDTIRSFYKYFLQFVQVVFVGDLVPQSYTKPDARSDYRERILKIKMISIE
ncbi:hypothetical protein Tco_1492159 [Tanacetum coccineum]